MEDNIANETTSVELKPSGYILIYIGRNIVISLVLLGVFYVYQNGLRPQNRNRIAAKVRNWDREAKKRMLNTYVYLMFSLLMTVFSVVCSFQSALMIGSLKAYPNTAVLLTTLAVALINGFIEVLPYTTQSPLEAAFTMLSSLIIGPAISLFGPYVVCFAAIYTILLLLLLTAMAVVAPRDSFYHSMSSLLSYLYIVVSIASVVTLLIGLPLNWTGFTILCISLYGGLILYAGIFLVNTQLFIKQALIGGQQYDPFYFTIVLYLCSINVFLRIAMYMIVIQLVTYTPNT